MRPSMHFWIADTTPSAQPTPDLFASVMHFWRGFASLPSSRKSSVFTPVASATIRSAIALCCERTQLPIVFSSVIVA